MSAKECRDRLFSAFQSVPSKSFIIRAVGLLDNDAAVDAWLACCGLQRILELLAGCRKTFIRVFHGEVRAVIRLERDVMDDPALRGTCHGSCCISRCGMACLEGF